MIMTRRKRCQTSVKTRCQTSAFLTCATQRSHKLRKLTSGTATSGAASGAMRIDIVTLFPEMFEPVLSASSGGRARRARLLDVRLVNPRDFVHDRHKTVDDRPFGGGAGMVLMAEPIYQALRRARGRGAKVVYLSPQGRRLDQNLARALARARRLVLLCGHYEGVDQRVLDRSVDLEVSIGDYVLTGGELPALVVVDAVARLLPGVLQKEEAAEKESFSGPILDFPQFTRPRVWRGSAVPEVLVSGDHRRIDAWRREAQLKATRAKRPDLLAVTAGDFRHRGSTNRRVI